MLKKMYVMHVADEIECIGIVAGSFGEAKKIASCELGCEWIHIRGRLKKDINASDMPRGIIDPEQGLELQIYQYVEDVECPKCGIEGTIYSNDGNPCCMDCREKQDVKSGSSTDEGGI